jgi:post-segregation antitoxin (ccd killing protein)
MPRIQLYLPDDLYQEVKSRRLPASEILQVAVRAVIEREKSREGLEQYVRELEEEIGSPTDLTRRGVGQQFQRWLRTASQQRSP